MPLDFKVPSYPICQWNWQAEWDPDWFVKVWGPSPPKQPAKLKQVVTDFLLKTYPNVDFDDESMRKELGIPTAEKLPMVYSKRKGFNWHFCNCHFFA